MKIVCLDFEGVLIPEVWQYVAKNTGIKDLMKTTRDVESYRELMDYRVKICYEHKITLDQIQKLACEMSCFEGAVEFVNWIRERYELIILSDTFYEFVPNFIKELGSPTLFCHSICFNENTGKLEYTLRQENQKEKAVKALQSLNFKIYAAGDSYNDITMLKQADRANFFKAPDSVLQDFPSYKNLSNYAELKKSIQLFFD